MWAPDASIARERIISPLTVVHRERLLAGPAQVLVSQGSRVEPADIVAESRESGSVRMLDAAQALGVAARKVADLMTVAVGEPVGEGQIIAKRGGLFRRSVTSPLEGVLLSLDERGRILVRGNPRRQEIRALMRGTVANVMPGQGVVIELHGAVVQGAWGNGLQSHGLIRLLATSETQTVDANLINAGVRDTIIVAGGTINEHVLRNSLSARVRGVVAGSMDGSLIPLASQMPYPILLLDGFGTLPMNQPSFSLLQQMEDREATISALYHTASGRVQPEVLIPLSGDAMASLMSGGPLMGGDRVRVTSAPYMAEMGTVYDLEERPQLLPSEITTRVCLVRLDRGDMVRIPHENLERLIR